MQPSPRSLAAILVALALALVLSCSSGGDGSGSSASPTAPSASPSPPPAQPTQPPPSPTPEPVRLDIFASRLTIPSLDIDEPVQTSRTIPYHYTPPPGCPPRPQDTETVTVPESGIATPGESIEGLENKAWIFGHSRWQGKAGVFLRLQELNPGDEIIVDGMDRLTGRRIERQRFIVGGLFLTDVDSGGELLNNKSPEDAPRQPQLILQTSVREDGPGKQWILDRQLLTSKSANLVQGDINDPCKYLLLFVVADAG